MQLHCVGDTKEMQLQSFGDNEEMQLYTVDDTDKMQLHSVGDTLEMQLHSFGNIEDINPTFDLIQLFLDNEAFHTKILADNWKLHT